MNKEMKIYNFVLKVLSQLYSEAMFIALQVQYHVKVLEI